MKNLDPSMAQQYPCGYLEREWRRQSVTHKGGFAMLVLSRKSRESVVIGGDDGIHRLLKVTVLGIQGTNVKLGFEVDPDCPVRRSEVCERIPAEYGLRAEVGLV